MQYVRLLARNREFAKLWAAMLISFVGDWFNTIVLAAIVSRFTEGSGLAIGLFMLARFLPPLLITPLAGALADRYNRKRLLIYADLLRAVVVLGFLLVKTPDQLWLLYALTIVQFCLGAIFEPSRSALLPSMVHRDDLVDANVLGSITWSAALALGGSLGGFVAGAFGAVTALTIDSVSFLISAAFIFTARPIYAVAVSAVEAQRERLSLRDITDGIRYAKAHPSTAATLLVKFGGNIGNIDTLLVIYGTVLFPLYIAGVTSTDEEAGFLSLGILWATFGIGSILGLIIIDRFNDGAPRTMRRLIALGYGLITISWFIFGFAPTLAIAALAMLIRAMGGNAYWTYSSVILQKTVEDRFMGRMFSLDFAGFQLSIVLSTIVTSAALEAVGNFNAPAVSLVTGVVSLLPLVAWTLALPWIERQEARENQAQALAAGD
ncbi:MAG: MFS transporter [Anaerolineae bacterium]|nr:MFS transporter [Anaerolineae bacterium]